MSEMERNVGKMKFLFDELTPERLAELCDKAGVEHDEETLLDKCYEKYTKINNKWYEIIEHKCTGECDFWAKVSKEGDIITFDTYHYNGGAYWTEVVENALKDLEEESK